MIKTKSYAGFDAHSPLRFHTFNRRDVGEHDIHIRIQYCGICHSDIHTVRNEWRGAHYPLVPGHEIIGTVMEVGSQVSKHQVGDVVGVGCMVNSCRHCEPCEQHQEQYCDKNAVFTYNSTDADGQITQGGYSDNIVVNQDFVLKIPPHLPLEKAAPLLCAGITTYSPLKHWNIGSKDTIGVVGLGGLGHMAIKLAHALGARVVLFTTSPHKKADALAMGADDVVISTDTRDMRRYHQQLDFILDTVSCVHDVNAYMNLLKAEKTLCMLGISPDPLPVNPGSLYNRRKNLSGSLIGGIAETQAMLDFCGQHNITCDVEVIPISEINRAYERVLQSDVKYRFVIDMDSLNHEHA